MESGKSITGYQYDARGSADPSSNILEMKIAELIKITEDIKKAKDDATQSWLDSRPLVDELEKLQKGLTYEKDRASKSNAVILDLESQLEKHRINMQPRKEEEIKIREMINQLTQSSDKLHEEMELLKLETDEERRARSKLKQALRLRKQTLQALQLTVRAVKIESESYGTQSAKALHYISCSQTDNDVVQLTQEEYDELTIKAREETALADWRVALATEQRSLAEKNQELARTRLQGIDKDSSSRGNEIQDNISGKDITRKVDDSRIEVEDQAYSRQKTFPKARAKLIAKSQPNPKQLKKSKSNNKRTAVKIKTPSIFVQIRTFLVRKITLWFG